MFRRNLFQLSHVPHPPPDLPLEGGGNKDLTFPSPRGNNGCFLILLVFVFLSFTLLPGKILGSDYHQLAGVLDTRSNFSDGTYSIEGLAKMSRERGIQVLFINDHDKTTLSYGLPPFPNIINKSEEMNSILKRGSEEYLEAIRQAQRSYKDVIIIPGTESAPFYFWTGNPLSNNLTAHDHERRILTVGLDKADHYRKMPVVHNVGQLNMNLLHGIIPFVVSFLLAAVMITWRGLFRITGIALAIISILFIIDNHPFRASPFDPFHGKQGIAPYQLLIDYVKSRGGMTFWNYPETKSGVRKLGPIHVSTKPYPEVLLESREYTGFAALYGENITITEPGSLWDGTLKEYCKGYRMRSPWGVATADYHKEGESGEKFGNFQTVFWVKENTKAAVLNAMQTGKMYARQGNFPNLPRLDEFSLSSADGRKRGISGDDIMIKGNPHIRIDISATKITPAAAATATLTPPDTTTTARAATQIPTATPAAATAAIAAKSANKSATMAAPAIKPTTPATSTLSPAPAATPSVPTVRVRLIRNGTMIQTFAGPLPLTIDYEDHFQPRGGKNFYRLDMEGAGKIVSNPIFVSFE